MRLPSKYETWILKIEGAVDDEVLYELTAVDVF